MNVFIWEALSAGAMGVDLPSLLREGRAMLEALAADVCAIEGAAVETIVDHRIPLTENPQRRVHHPSDAADELRLFRELAARCDVCWIIAPEIDDLLPRRMELAESVGGRVVGSDIATARLCGDKLALAKRLVESDIPTIETRLLDRDAPPAFAANGQPFPSVIKPRHGAGSVGCRRVDDRSIWNDAMTDCDSSEWIVQPLIAGVPMSIAAVIREGDERIELLPVARQLLADDGRFTYLGGVVDGRSPIPDEIARLVRKVRRALPGLAGYVGFDLLVPPAGDGPVTLVEINPRLTTSYIGYREMALGNIAERVLQAKENVAPLSFRSDVVRYFPDGRTSVDRCPI